jgi:8-oxo-dGTP pyrophosphatase MutT (NUDIX family)
MDNEAVTLRQATGRLLTPFYMVFNRMMRGMTLGVRGAVLDDRGRVFLVKHTYVPGWYLPGGGVDPGETIEEAIAREVREEGNITITAPPQMLGLYQNREISRRDHVAFFVIRSFSQAAPALANFEIAASGFFALDALPADTTLATHRRLGELAGTRQPDGYW